MKLIYMEYNGKEWVEFSPKWNWKYEWVNTVYMTKDTIVTYLRVVCKLFPDHAPIETIGNYVNGDAPELFDEITDMIRHYE